MSKRFSHPTALKKFQTPEAIQTDGQDSNQARKIVFVFSGQGSQAFGMGQQLLDQEPMFRATVEQCDQAMRQYVDWSLLEELTANEAQSRLDQIDVMWPALFAISAALAALWRSWDIEPDAVVGHSLGEVAAAHVAGALSLEDAVRVVYHQSRLVKRISGQGAMALVELSWEQAQQALVGYENRLCLAISSSPTTTVLSGDPAALAEVLHTLKCQDIFCRFVRTDAAVHSPQIDCLQAELASALSGLQPRRASVPIVSALTAKVLDGYQFDSSYWVHNLREPVLFSHAVAQLLHSGHDIFLELSPQPILGRSIEQSLMHHKRQGTVLASLRLGEDERAVMLDALEVLYSRGLPVNWDQLDPAVVNTVPLTTVMLAEVSPPVEEKAPTAAKLLPTSARELLLASPPEECQQLVESYLQELVSTVLKVDSSQLDRLQPLTALGLDSLLASQITYRVGKSFQVMLPLQSLFESASIADLSKSIVTILQEQATRDEDDVRCLDAIVPAPDQRYQPFPLTDIQQAYWMGRSGAFELGNVATHVYIEIGSSSLDLEQLSAAWQKLIERHDMLRAVVLPTGEQKILEQVPTYEIKVLDLNGLEPEVVTAQLTTVRDEMAQQVLLADQWPLFEIRATRLNKQHARLHVSLDLLMADLWTVLLLFQEWHQLYKNSKACLTPLEISFRDYVLTEIALRDTQLYQRSQDYWFRRIDTLPPSPELPLAQNPGSITQPRFFRRSFQLDPETWQQLKQRARQVGLTPSGVLLAAFAEVLTVWSKSPRFTINLTLFNRLPLHPQVNDIVGDFTSVTLLAVDNSAPEPFAARAIRLQQQLWQDLDHRYVSGVHVLREIYRRQGGAPRVAMPVVFTSALGLGSCGQEDLRLNYFGEVVYSITQTPQVWLDHQVIEQDGVLICNWDAVEELFPEGLLDDMFETYYRFLMQLVSTESVWLEATPQLVPPTQLQQRYAVNATTAPTSEEMLHSLFTAQVKACTHDYAVISPQRTLTYLELFNLANQLGYRLLGLGACPNTLIAVVMELGWEQVVAVLGILMSGAAYMPIDPELPTERRWHLLEQGQVKLVLTKKKLNQNLEWPEGIQRLQVDTESLVGAEISPRPPVQSPEDLAYVIYTSGSTGLPKGVTINHRGAVNTIKDINQRFGVGPQDRLLALSALNFDLSVYDIFGILAAGGTLVIPEAGRTKDPAHMAQLIVQHQVTIWNSVPALMQMLVEYVALRPEKLPTPLRLALLSGDWIPLHLPGQIKALWPNLQVVSLGGATEASIWSIYYPIETIDADLKRIPYGKPLTNQSFHVLNELLEPCPVWVSGQLYIGGIGLALGYWRDQLKTQASFIIHPRSKERLYRTGDLGRYLPNGNIEFLGREDFQVKVNGLRIELGEIEAVLAQHSGVHEAVVIAQSDHLGDKRLVAYVVPNQEQVPTDNELSCFLKQKLPTYMLPSSYLLMDTLPLTPNGKLNRRALPAVDQVKNEPREIFVAPRDDLELHLTRIWEKVLGIQPISVTDNFFALGGHSLLAARLFAQIEQTFGKNLPLSILFQSPTVEQLTSILRQQGMLAPCSSLVAIQPAGSKLPLFCIGGAGGDVFYFRDLSNRLGLEQPIYGLQAQGLDGKQAPHTRIEDMAAHYIKEIRTFQSEGPYFLAGHSVGGLVAFEMAQQLQMQGQEVGLLAIFDAGIFKSIDSVPSFWDKASFHLSNLIELEPKNKLSYVPRMLSASVKSGVKNMSKKIASLVGLQSQHSLTQELGGPEFLPQNVRRMFKLNEQAARDYVPQVYLGQVTFFRATNNSTSATSRLRWSRLAAGGLEVHKVPGDHSFADSLLSEPNVSVLAEKLKACLEQAQKSATNVKRDS